MKRPRLIASILIIGSLIALAVSSVGMARRLGQRDNHLVYFTTPVAEPEFAFLEEPAQIATVDTPAADGSPQRTLEIRWRGSVHSVPIVNGMREDDRLPGLLRHDDWLRVLSYAEGAKTEADIAAGVASGTLTPHLIVAMRFPPEGFDPGSWGGVRRRDWRYRFVELIHPSRSPEPFKVTESTYRDIEKLGDPRYRKANALEADYWQYAAMEQVTPPTLFRSKNRNMSEAMDAMGWTWPTAGASMMGILAGVLVLALSGGRRSEA